MQFRKPFKEAIRTGSVTCSFRAWKKPHAKVGGRYNLHPLGAIEVTSIEQTCTAAISSRDITAAGFSSRAELEAYIDVHADDIVYRVEFRYLGGAPVNQPTTTALSQTEANALLERVGALDRRAAGAWSKQVLTLIAHNPGRRAADLAAEAGSDVAHFKAAVRKAAVRKLKRLGLTLSGETGYQLSPRGEQILRMKSCHE